MARRLQPEHAGQSLCGRYREAGGMHESEQFEQVQPRQFGIAQPLRDQWRIEQDHRCFGRFRHRLGLADPARFAIG